MKHILLALILILLSISVQAQTPVTADAPFKKANAVLVVTPDSAVVALKKIGAILVQKGYNIKKLDTDFNTLLTEPKAVKGGLGNTVIVVRAVAIPTGLSLLAEITADMSAFAPGMERTVARVSSSGKDPKGFYSWLIEIAKAYPNAQVRYAQD